MSQPDARRPRRRRSGRRGGPSGGTGGQRRRRLTPEQVAARAASVPTVGYPEELPVSQRRDDIAAAIRDHQVVIVAGETGSGKTTQLPKICLELGRGVDGLIGHTQPRRIAARSVAERVAQELGVELGEQVGYQVRFTDRAGPQTLVKLMTDGILLAELQHDRMLSAYDTIIVDEAHERSLNIDFILGYLKRLLPKRPDLKVIITSATIDPERFAQHFAAPDGSPAPIVEVSGRTYPVEVRYRPLVDLEGDGGSDADEEGELVVRDQTEAIVDAVAELVREGPGDILVFLPGEREIRDTAEVLEGWSQRARVVDRFEVVPLFARLSAAEQHRVFAPHGGRRVVLATNVAETSLTVPGIRYVVDSGVARISRYSVRTKVQRLPIEAISQASANQRAGRCGRVAAGVCIRLYSEDDYLARPEFTEAEILRTNLASVILQMTALGLGDVGRFPFVDPPDQRNVRAGVQLLEELGAIVEREGVRRLTPVGRSLVTLPIDPRLARMVVEADRRGCLREVLVIAAALSIQDPRERPLEKRAQADQLHARFVDPTSDFLTWLNLWRHLRTQQQEMGSSAFRRTCRQEFLNYVRIREWQDLESQLRQVAKQLQLAVPPPADEPDADGIHQALLAGLLSHIGLKETEERTPSGQRGSQQRGGPKGGRRDKREYLGARGTRFAIFPGSALFKKQPELVMAAELVETSRLWGRQNAAIRPEWAEELGAHLVKRTYAEPHWSKKRAAVVARERVTLYGVPLVADRAVDYGRIDPPVARELFIRHALVYGEWHTRARFFGENRALLEEVAELESRARRRDLLVDEHTLFDFYDARIPDGVVSGAHFDSWWKRERQRRPELLTFDPAMLVNDAAEEVRESDFPLEWREDGASLPISYHFEPGADDDGLTIDVPVATLNRLDEQSFSWSVPGLREELVVALLRSLPKPLRTQFVPAPDHARAFLAAVPPGEEPLLDALERHLRGLTGTHVPRDAWDWTKVPAHLQPRFRVVADDGSVLGEGKDLEALKAPLRPRFAEAVAEAAASSGLTATGETTWSFGTVEESFTQQRAGHEVRAFPAVVDEIVSRGTATVGLDVLGTPAEQEAAHRRGVRRLVDLAMPALSRTLLDELDTTTRLALAAAPYPTVGELVDDCRLAAVDQLIERHGWRVWDEESFDRLRTAVGAEVATATRDVLSEVVRVLERWREVDRALSGSVDLVALPAVADMRAQVARLVHRGFVGDAGGDRLRHLPRYLAAVQHRRERLDPHRDRLLMDQLADLQAAVLHRYDALPAGRPAPLTLERARWQLEELRVSLFAQHLGTAEKVSVDRVRRTLEGS